MATSVTVVGNCTRDPELRFVSNGKAVANFSVAVSEGHRGSDGKWVEDSTSFYNVAAWDSLGENVAESIRKGDRVVVTGRLKLRAYDKNDGSKGMSVDITADEVGPSLRWASATVAKNQRDGAASGSSRRAADPAASDADYGFAPADEEPF